MRTPLQKGEKILLVTYSSWVALVWPAILAILGLAASYFIGFMHWGWLAAVVGLLCFLIPYYRWKVNIWVVTNCRVIDEAGLFNHYAKESRLDKINNVSYDQTLWGRILNFGHIKIQTAAELGATDYYRVNHPKRLKDTITAAQSEFTDLEFNNQAARMAAAMGIQGNAGASATQVPNIAAELEKLFELKMKGAISEEEYNRAKARLLNH